MKSEEFWLGVSIYCVIALVGHLGPDFSKSSFLNKKITDFFHSRVPADEVKRETYFPTIRSARVDIVKCSKGIKGYVPVRSNKFRRNLMPSGKVGSDHKPERFKKPIEPIVFYL
jgi:hypothetical protein